MLTLTWVAWWCADCLRQASSWEGGGPTGTSFIPPPLQGDLRSPPQDLYVRAVGISHAVHGFTNGFQSPGESFQVVRCTILRITEYYFHSFQFTNEVFKTSSNSVGGKLKFYLLKLRMYLLIREIIFCVHLLFTTDISLYIIWFIEFEKLWNIILRIMNLLLDSEVECWKPSYPTSMPAISVLQHFHCNSSVCCIC